MVEKAKSRGYGWHPDLPDHRDHKFVPTINRLILPPSTDLRGGCPPVYDQGQLGSCTANAIAAALEFDRKKQGLPDWVPSRLFIYWVERAFEGTIASDAGAQIRDGIKVVNKKGAPQEASWPYDIAQFTTEPPPAVWSEAYHHKAVKYQSVHQDLAHIKSALVAGFPIVFGFSVYEAFESQDVANTGVLNLPASTEQMVGGHAVLIVGFDDASQRVIVRNSWGAGWGQAGYFTMPYAYVTNPDLASDFWIIQSVK
jgi:C1A family cysteine protease